MITKSQDKPNLIPGAFSQPYNNSKSQCELRGKKSASLASISQLYPQFENSQDNKENSNYEYESNFYLNENPSSLYRLNNSNIQTEQSNNNSIIIHPKNQRSISHLDLKRQSFSNKDENSRYSANKLENTQEQNSQSKLYNDIKNQLITNTKFSKKNVPLKKSPLPLPSNNGKQGLKVKVQTSEYCNNTNSQQPKFFDKSVMVPKNKNLNDSFKKNNNSKGQDFGTAKTYDISQYDSQKLKEDNMKLKEEIVILQSDNKILDQKSQHLENKIMKLNDQIYEERAHYQSELLKIAEQIQKFKHMQQMEKLAQEDTLNQQNNIIGDYKKFLKGVLQIIFNIIEYLVGRVNSNNHVNKSQLPNEIEQNIPLENPDFWGVRKDIFDIIIDKLDCNADCLADMNIDQDLIKIMDYVKLTQNTNMKLRQQGDTKIKQSKQPQLNTIQEDQKEFQQSPEQQQKLNKQQQQLGLLNKKPSHSEYIPPTFAKIEYQITKDNHFLSDSFGNTQNGVNNTLKEQCEIDSNYLSLGNINVTDEEQTSNYMYNNILTIPHKHSYCNTNASVNFEQEISQEQEFTQSQASNKEKSSKFDFPLYFQNMKVSNNMNIKTHQNNVTDNERLTSFYYQQSDNNNLFTTTINQDGLSTDQLTFDQRTQGENNDVQYKQKTQYSMENFLDKNSLHFTNENEQYPEQVVKTNESNLTSQKGNNTASTNTSSNQDGTLAKALYNYEAEKENDLTLNKGDIIQILKKTKNGWWIGLSKNKIGYFPSNYVEIINE